MAILNYDGTSHLIKKVVSLINGKADKNHKHTKSDITDFPTLGTASSKDVASTGNASATQVVMGNDTRLTDARKASDVSAWAKESIKPSYTKSEVGLGDVDNTSDINKPVSTAQQTAIDTAYANSNKYTDQKIADLIDGAPETMDTLKEVHDAIEENKNVEKALNAAIGTKANQSELDTHTSNTTIHTTASERTNWNAAKTHADSTHARTDATKVEKSITNGNIKINGTETNVYTHPSGTNPHGTTKSDVGLENVGNYKAVSTVASQGLSDTEKANARANIGAGTSNFDGNYNSLSNKPTIPTSLPAKGGDASTVNGHAVNADVPSDAKFTDTDTWRGIQDNLTSDSKTDSLSAAQGKALKALVDSKTSNTGTITGIKMNGASKGTSGVVDLGTVLTGGKQSSTSTADGGSNVYTFSDGSTITVKNGSKGSPGADGDSVAISSISESEDDGGDNVVTFSDGSKLTVKNGNRGSSGASGSSRITYYETRPTSANKTSSSDRAGSVEAFVASSKMTTGKPSGDAKILHMNWDNTSGWDSQFAMLNNGKLQHRSMSNGSWSDWKTVLDSSNWGKLCNIEDGEITPNFYDSSGNKQTFNIVTSYYKRVKNLCYINIYAAVTEEGKTLTTKYIDGLPFEPNSTIHPKVLPCHIVGNMLINGKACFVNVPEAHGQLSAETEINGSLLIEGFYSI